MANRSVVVERRIAAPAERVWSALTDLERAPEVLSGVESVELLSPGPFGVGTRWRETRRMLGTSATEEMWVTASEPPLGYVVEAESRGAHYVSDFALRPAGPEATDVRMTFTARPPGGAAGLLAKVFGALGARAVAKAIARDLADVAAAVEGRSPPAR
ncbi:SRPBCC family protein [Streptomyces inusitatus]|uniref:SRPBCC family protein n=1 Tax=Streptomyces inusitatus TaxID=68221 RepID=UPI00167E6AF9|nr:SRPBCC family protein [Streptomyces inusitatus]